MAFFGTSRPAIIMRVAGSLLMENIPQPAYPEPCFEGTERTYRGCRTRMDERVLSMKI